MFQGSRDLRRYAQEQRNNMTRPEKLLWARIRMKRLAGCQFYRQKVIGNYIADFCCPRARLIIELDGNQHYTHDGKKADNLRDEIISSRGIDVLRFANEEVTNNIDGVIETILKTLKQRLRAPP